MSEAPRTLDLVKGAVPALLVGVLAGALLWALDGLAELISHGVWELLPTQLGVPADSAWWIILVLTVTGLLVGLIVQFVPGRGGHDTATIELVAPVERLSTLPSIAAVLVIGLAGGVSLGPEGPIIAIVTALAVAALGRLAPGLGTPAVMMIAVAGTVGAMFGTPVAAALLLTSILAAASSGGSLWDRLFLPIVAAGAGSLTTLFLGGPSITLSLPTYHPALLDLLSGTLIAVVAGGVGVLAALTLPRAHALFRRLRYPVVYITLGGLLLGVLGALGGSITLFKGLNEMVVLLTERDGLAPLSLVLIIVVKLAALVIAAGAGFRGGRIFPGIFIGVAIGILANALFPAVPISLAVAAGVLGVILVIAKDGWLALFLAAAVSGDIATLPMLCFIVLPTWLLARSVPEMIVRPAETDEPATR